MMVQGLSNRMKRTASYKITLQVLQHPVDPGARLQRLLKLALRRCFFRCVNIEEIAGVDDADNNPESDDLDQAASYLYGPLADC